MILKQAEQWPHRFAVSGKDEPVWMAGIPADPLDPKATLHSFLLTPEDAYDQWDWKKRHKEHPPIPTPNHVQWYHATPVELSVGTVLAPHHPPPWKENPFGGGAPYNNGLDNRANFIWVEYDLTHSDDWIKYMVRDHGQSFLYKVKPRLGPFPWNGTALEGWVSDMAIITDILAAYKGTEDHVKRVA